MFRFTIRDVLWLTVVVALALGWLVDHLQLGRVVNAVQERRDLVEFKLRIATTAIEQNGFEVRDIGRGMVVQPKAERAAITDSAEDKVP